jgi:class 3 adenylate cyclase
VCGANGIDTAILEKLAVPLILHYCGYRIADTSGTSPLPAEVEREVTRQVDDFVESRAVGFAYGSLASGGDILVAEALLERGAHVHVVLPCAAEEFDRASVAPAGRIWSDRFRSCLERASSVIFASDSSFADDAELFRYAGRIAMGHALNRAALLDAPVEQIAVCNEAGDGFDRTAPDVEAWRRTGNSTHVIPLPNTLAAVRPPMTSAAQREIGAMLFTDFRGFSRLRDEHLPTFVNEVFAALGAFLDARDADIRWRNSWGDAIAAVFSDVTAAADCALGLHDTLAAFDLASLGLPTDLHMRIGAHAGPVFAFDDPITHRRTYWGRELTRAARIEPRTPEGEVYVTDAFAALLALEPGTAFATDYVGRITTAKDFETIPMYRLRRASRR